MPNRTIYVKDEDLWNKAKHLAGKDGLSALIGQALEEIVERKLLEEQGFQLQRIFVHGNEGRPQIIRFNGRQVGSRLLADSPEGADGIVEAFETKGGKLVLVLREFTGKAFEYRTYDSLEELGKDLDTDVFSAVAPEAREEFLESLAHALGQEWSVWID